MRPDQSTGLWGGYVDPTSPTCRIPACVFASLHPSVSPTPVATEAGQHPRRELLNLTLSSEEQVRVGRALALGRTEAAMAIGPGEVVTSSGESAQVKVTVLLKRRFRSAR